MQQTIDFLCAYSNQGGGQWLCHCFLDGAACECCVDTKVNCNVGGLEFWIKHLVASTKSVNRDNFKSTPSDFDAKRFLDGPLDRTRVNCPRELQSLTRI